TLAESLAAQGIFVHVITLAKAERTVEVSRGRLRVTYLAVPKLVNMLTIYGYTRWVTQKLIRASQPDLVHGIGTEHVWSTVALDSGFPAIITIHGVMHKLLHIAPNGLVSRHRYFAALEKRVLRKARHVITVSPYVSRVLHEFGDCVVYPIENPVADRFFSSPSGPSRENNVLFVGNTELGKGLLTLLQALAIIQERTIAADWRLNVVGPAKPGPYYDQIKTYLKAHYLDGKVTFRGFLMPHEMVKEYARAAFLVLPSKQETAPMCITEAMACGKPAIATAVGGVPHLIDDGRTGFLFHEGDAVALADRMLQLISDPELRAEMGAAARTEAERRWRADRIAQQTIQVYEQVLAQSGESR
ncbi:MAG: glycosyltransferase family 4 protein, partial [Candidatus Korobacteraceae bacterium]